MIALTPVVEATTTARSNSIARIRAMASCCSVSPSLAVQLEVRVVGLHGQQVGARP